MLSTNKFREFLTGISKIINAHNVRYYSRYPPNVVEPVYDVEEVEKIVKEKNDIDIKLMKIKAATHSATCSVYFDPDVHHLSQRLMRNGNRKLAKSLVDNAFEVIKKLQLEKYYNLPEESRDKIELNPRVIFRKAVENTTPVLGTKMIKRSGTWYNIPCMITPKRAKFLAIKYITESALEKGRNDRYYYTLAEELIKASQNKGKAVQKKIDLHKYCEANRAYAHYRWT